MKINERKPPRIFQVGFDKEKIDIADCGSVDLSANEQLTFITPEGGEYDVARKNFGFYATPSLNGRLKRFNLRAALVKNRINQYFILLVETGKEALFHDYIEKDRQELVCWLDNDDNLNAIASAFQHGDK